MVDQHVKLKVVATFEYEAHPDDYGTSVPAEMAKIDQTNFRDDPGYFFSLLSDEGTITVEPA